ncbi:hypothetical protein [Pseudolabrys taiwanensis]
MPNGTRLTVLRQRSDGWWLVRILATGQEGWALSRIGGKPFIECCVSPNQNGTANQTASQPSFDCTKARAPDEVAICSNPELAKLDTRRAFASSRSSRRGLNGL